MTNRIEKTFEYTVGKEIVEQIYVQLGIDLSCAEVYYITQCLLASKKIFDTGEATDNAHVKAARKYSIRAKLRIMRMSRNW